MTFFAASLLLAGSPARTDPQWKDLLQKANHAYKEGDFEQAVRDYLRLVRSDHENGHLYYNLGNACFRLGQPGEAILNYERARILIPRDADLNYNLGYVRDRTLDVIPEKEGLTSMTFFWLDSLSLHELVLGFAMLNVLFWMVLFLRLFHLTEWTYYLALLALIFWFVTGASLGLKWHRISTDDRAVILEKEVRVLAGPDSRDTLLFKLHEGAIVHYERSEEGWSLIGLPDKKRGWVESGALERVSGDYL